MLSPLRSLRADEAPAARAGLHPRNPTSTSTVLDHVTGGSSVAAAGTNYVSTTLDLSVALLWSVPFGRTAIIHPALAELAGTRFVFHDELMAELQHDERGRAYVRRSREQLVVGSVPAWAVEDVLCTITAVYDAFPPGPLTVNVDYLSSLVVCPPAATSRISPDWGVSLLGRATTPAGGSGGGPRPLLAAMRASPNSLPPELTTLDKRLQACREQLQAALRVYTDEDGAGRVSYVEVDVSLSQRRVVTHTLPSAMRRVPVLLVAVDGDGALAEAILLRLYRLKKGGDAITKEERGGEAGGSGTGAGALASPPVVPVPADGGGDEVESLGALFAAIMG